MAERAFNEMPTTRGAGVSCSRNSSANVVDNSWRALWPMPLTGMP
jgi:hypothetical protein